MVTEETYEEIRLNDQMMRRTMGAREGEGEILVARFRSVHPLDPHCTMHDGALGERKRERVRERERE